MKMIRELQRRILRGRPSHADHTHNEVNSENPILSPGFHEACAITEHQYVLVRSGVQSHARG